MSFTREAWTHEQDFERSWWDDCRNTFGEEAKQVTYARRMGLEPFNDGGRWPLIEGHGMSILDVGGGPTSMLLKVRNLGTGVVVDPCDYPGWTRHRYDTVGITVHRMPAEDYRPDRVYDEVWCYNVLQHTHQPERIVDMMMDAAKRVRIFEWVDMPPSPGHPHELKADALKSWLAYAEEDEDWLAVSDIVWDLNVGAPIRGGKALHGYVHTLA